MSTYNICFARRKKKNQHFLDEKKSALSRVMIQQVTTITTRLCKAQSSRSFRRQSSHVQESRYTCESGFHSLDRLGTKFFGILLTVNML